jgi:hypothetical protein
MPRSRSGSRRISVPMVRAVAQRLLWPRRIRDGFVGRAVTLAAIGSLMLVSERRCDNTWWPFLSDRHRARSALAGSILVGLLGSMVRRRNGRIDPEGVRSSPPSYEFAQSAYFAI